MTSSATSSASGGFSTRSRVYFVACGTECNPDAISAATGVAPTKTWRIGDIRQERTGKTHLDCGWRLDADHTEAHDVETQITSLVAALWPAHDYPNALSAHCEGQFSIVVHCGASAPSVCFSTGLMQRIAQLGRVWILISTVVSLKDT
jgi:hypothetical protein